MSMAIPATEVTERRIVLTKSVKPVATSFKHVKNKTLSALKPHSIGGKLCLCASVIKASSFSQQTLALSALPAVICQTVVAYVALPGIIQFAQQAEKEERELMDMLEWEREERERDLYDEDQR